MPAENEEITKREFRWPAVLYYIHLHALGVYGLILLFTEAKWATFFFTILIVTLAMLGITVGSHRLWAHRSFEATWHVRLLLMLSQTLAGVGNIHDWVLDHRLHHRFYETDRDPHNHKKGFIYSHVISNLLTEHPEKEKISKDISMRDMDVDRFVWVQRWFYWIIFPVVGLLLPINAPAEYWGESIKNSIFILGFLRLAITVNLAWLVNSAAIVWGLKSGEKYPVDDNWIFIIKRSYWPNYHYMLPWDWKSGEYGNYSRGFGTFFIKICKAMGEIESLKTASTKSIQDALYQSTTGKRCFEDQLDVVKKLADEEAIKSKLRYRH